MRACAVEALRTKRATSMAKALVRKWESEQVGNGQRVRVSLPLSHFLTCPLSLNAIILLRGVGSMPRHEFVPEFFLRVRFERTDELHFSCVCFFVFGR